MFDAKQMMPKIIETPNISLVLFSTKMPDRFQKDRAGSG
jgi:hypothetical protein